MFIKRMQLREGYCDQSAWSVGKTFKSRRVSTTRGNNEKKPMIIIIVNCLLFVYNYG